MLARANRLRRAEFNEYFKRGKRLHGDHFTVVYVADSDFKVSVVVSKKVAKKAHDRNRLKRQIYGFVGLLSKETNVAGVFMIYPKLALTKLVTQKRKEVIKGELSRLLNTR